MRVRAQAGGEDAYVGIYSWNNGNPNLMLFERTGGNWTQLGNAYICGSLPAGTQLKLMVVGNTIAFLQNGVERVAVGSTDLAGGAPGIIVNGTGQSVAGPVGTAGFEVHYLSTDANGVQSYDVISANNGSGPQVLRILRPTNPAPGVPHSFICVPVEAGPGTTSVTVWQVVQAFNAQNKYNLTIIEPSFGIDPWYANNPIDPNLRQETFMTHGTRALGAE